MLDNLPAETLSVSSWQDNLQYGDILLFRFPAAEDGAQSPSKIRPCLVLDVEEYLGDKFLWLAYGTTASTKANKGYEIRVTDPAAIASCSLERATRFVGRRRILVAASHAGFEIPKGYASPRLGRLSGPEMGRLNRVRARLHAEADMAAERRLERRPRRRKSAVRGRDFVVETRTRTGRRLRVQPPVQGGQQ